MTETEVRVEKLVWRGRALARLPSGQVVLIAPGVFPGELVRVRIQQARKDYLLAEASAILEPHPGRRPHPCPQSPWCGGCRFGALRVRDQLALKRSVLVSELTRTSRGAVEPQVLEGAATWPSPKAWRYRWRGQVHVRQGRPHVMAHGRAEPLACTDCLLLTRELGRRLPQLAQGLPEGRFTVAHSPLSGPPLSQGDPGPLVLPLPGPGLELRLAPKVFFQANWALNQDLVAHVCRQVGPGSEVLDLYAGAGNFALPLAGQGCRVWALEADPEAVRAVGEAAGRFGLSGLSPIRADLRSPGPLPLPAGARPLAAVVDPPRTGGGKVLVRLLESRGLGRIVWVSCDLVNTARDIRHLVDNGWSVTRVDLFDMFPQTWHQEAVLVLDRA
jgi:23S rRNA (uracil1939-C5)-methyltransferase